jgi:phage terminase large subunit GpA-like protein
MVKPCNKEMAGSRIKRGVKVWPVATSLLKSELFGWLRLERPTDESGDPFPAGYCHFPKYHDEYFKQLTAEQLMSRTVRGYRRTEWQKTRERNEALIAEFMLGLRLKQMGSDSRLSSSYRR